MSQVLYAENPLCNYLASRSPTLAQKAIHIIRHAEEFLNRVVATFPTGTDHGPQHTRTVEQIAFDIIEADAATHLNEHELFFLALACHYHDLGMAGGELDNENTESRTQVRHDHAVRIGSRLEEEWVSLGFDHQGDATVLGDICKAHRPKRDESGHANWNDYPSVKIIRPGSSIRLRLVAAILFAADELHIGKDRAPKRTEEFAKIRNPESRRHWFRHQCVSGPALTNGALSSDIRVGSPVEEGDLRTNHLAKAFRGVDDLRRLSIQENFNHQFPEVRVRWDRKPLWKLLLIDEASDLVSRSIEELAEIVVSRYLAEQKDADNLTDLAIEVNNSKGEMLQEARIVIEDFVQQRHFIRTDGRLILSTSEASFEYFQGVLGEADTNDSLLETVLPSKYSFALFRKKYGEHFISNTLIPRLTHSLQVFIPLNESGDVPLAEVLRVSPSACKLLASFESVPNPVEKRDVAALLVLSGLIVDALHDPTILLDNASRSAVRRLFAYAEATLPKTNRFLEELVLVAGLNLREVADIIVPSKELAKAIHEPPTREGVPQSVQLTVTQTLPKAFASENCSLYHLLLASLRTGIELRVTGSERMPIKVDVKGESPAGVQPNSDIQMFSIRPNLEAPAPFADVPCQIEVDDASKTISLRIFRFDDPKDVECPFVFKMDLRQRLFFGESKLNGSIQGRPHRMKMHDLRIIERANRLLKKGTAMVTLVDGASNKVVSEPTLAESQEWSISRYIPAKLHNALMAAGEHLPIPLLKQPIFRELSNAPARKRKKIIEKALSIPRSKKKLGTVCLFRVCNADGQVITEKFAFALFGEVFRCPIITFINESDKEKFEKEWSDPTKPIKLECHIGCDPFQLEKEFADWFGDLRQEFPVKYDNSAPPPPATKCMFAIELRQHVEHSWFVEMPVILTVRPPTEIERLYGEKRFWEWKGDKERTLILDERIALAAKDKKVGTVETAV
ncbi:MAG: HD domain-containing protein [Planctomycetales bacterium]|nr:HD domain-containing protein [Planctomycetales bacterium]